MVNSFLGKDTLEYSTIDEYETYQSVNGVHEILLLVVLIDIVQRWDQDDINP